MKGFWSLFGRLSVVSVFAAVLFAYLTVNVLTNVVLFIESVIAGLIGQGGPLGLVLTIRGAEVYYGQVLAEVISAASIVGVAYWLLQHPDNEVVAWLAEITGWNNSRECPHCLSRIPSSATRCSFCTSDVEPTQGGNP